MIEVLRFWVPGNPKTKGSLEVINSGRVRGRAVLRDTPASKRWRQMVAHMALAEKDRHRVRPESHQDWPLVGPVRVDVHYSLPVSTIAELIAQGAGDKDKLDRNVYDALQDAGIYANDSQVVDGASKKSVAMGRGAGAEIVVSIWG